MASLNPKSPSPEMIDALIASRLITSSSAASFEALTGGVSSDIWKVTTPERVFCVKQALSKLKVERDWFAPVERNEFEVAWYSVANRLVPGAAPGILMHDKRQMLFAMDYLDPSDHQLWKTELSEGRTDPSHAAEMGRRLSLIHGGTAGDRAVEKLFPRADIFHAIRLEPYLEATALSHPDLGEVLFSLSQDTAKVRLCMVHGDVSPKNILLGPGGPVILDAECACIGDPAFDLAFCLNHFLLKCLWAPASTKAFLANFQQMTIAYLTHVTWEPADQLEQRASRLLPGLLLARVDGKSPVEYVTEERQKEQVRTVGRALLLNPPTRLAEISNAWAKELDE